VHSMGVALTGVGLMGVHLMGVGFIVVHLMCGSHKFAFHGRGSYGHASLRRASQAWMLWVTNLYRC
jgi:hypothetical protein